MEKLRDFEKKNSEISQKTESTGGFDPKILQNFGEKKKPGKPKSDQKWWGEYDVIYGRPLLVLGSKIL